jgi:predicted phosphodiesterase
MTHIGGYPGHYNPWLLPMFRKSAEAKAGSGQNVLRDSIDLFVCGHSHILKVQYDKQFGFLTMNPGAAGREGWQKVQTLLRFVIDGKEIRDLEVIELDRR